MRQQERAWPSHYVVTDGAGREVLDTLEYREAVAYIKAAAPGPLWRSYTISPRRDDAAVARWRATLRGGSRRSGHG